MARLEKKHEVIEATQARTKFSELTNRVAFGGERLLIGKHGKNMVAIIPAADLELLERLEDARDLKRVREAMKAAGSTPWAKFKADRGL